MEENLFEKEQVKRAGTGLMIKEDKERFLSKEQQTFNKQVKKIEKLRLELEQLIKSLDEKMDYYGKHIYPLLLQINELTKEAIKQLFGFYKKKKLLSKWEKDSLANLIAGKLDQIFNFNNEEPEDEFKKIFKAVQGISYDEVVKDEFNDMMQDVASMFKNAGFEADFSGLHSKMTLQEMLENMMRMEEPLNQKQQKEEYKGRTRKKTKKQEEKEAREKALEEARTKNIRTIYKQLAKIFHPDLEQNEELKLQKEELMKQLTNAYENNDLHTLLSLELAWIQNEDNKPDKLPDNKLAIYNELLKEQILELESEKNKVIQDPRYEALHRFTLFPDQIKSFDFKREKQQIEADKVALARELSGLMGPENQALSSLRKWIKKFEREAGFNRSFSGFAR